MSTLEAVRRTPEVIGWALAVFVCGVVVLPICHLVGHADDHVHGALHTAGVAHDHPAAHGEGDGLHFGLALLEVDVPALDPPVHVACDDAARAPTSPPLLRSRLTSIRPGAP